jgi:UDP-N-acetylglucosamine acyltransferase
MISPLAHVDPNAQLGENVTVHPFAYIDKDVVIGDGCEVFPYASVLAGARIGKNSKIYHGAVISAEPQDFRWKGELTYCYIGDNTSIREHVIINRGVTAEKGTSIGSDCFVMAQSHVGHDSHIADKCIVGNGVKIAGDCDVDTCTILSSGVILHEGAQVGRCVLIKGGCRISSNVPPYIIMAHNPAVYYGVNAFVMRQCKLSEDEIDNVAKAYRHIYQCTSSVFNAIKRVEQDIEPTECRDEIIRFVKAHDYRLVNDRFENFRE